MKKLILPISILCFLFLGILSLYIFNLPPFNTAYFKKFTQSTEVKKLPEDAREIPQKLSYTERIEKGDKLAENKYFTLAIREYSLASEEEPNKIEPFIKIGKIHSTTKSYQKAVENFKKASEQDSSNIEAKINIIRAYILSDNWQEAKNTVDQIKEPNQIAKYYQGIIAVYFKNHEEAKKYFKEAFDLKTTEDFSKKAEKFLKTYENYDNILKSQPDYFYTLIAKTANENNEFMLAISLLEDVTKKITDYRDAWILLGYANLSLENYQPAIENFGKALALDPEKSETRYFLGLSYFGIDNNNEAITNLEIALQNGFEPKNEIYQKLAEMYLMQKDYESAIENYEKVLQKGDEDVDYYIRPIWILVEHLKSPEKCLKMASQTVAKHPAKGMSYNLMGWCYLSAKNYVDAKNNFEKAINLEKSLSAAYLNLGKLYQEQGNLNSAKDNYKKAYDLSPSSSIGNLAATLYNGIIEPK